MKTFRSIAAVFAFAAIFAVSGFAQTTPTAPSKIGIINTQFFEQTTGGITRYVNALNSLAAELKPDATALQAMINKSQTLQKEIADIEKQLNDPKLPQIIDKNKLFTTGQAKAQELEDLGRQFKFEEEKYKVKLERGENRIVSPIRRDIGNALNEFAKKNGYTMILDVSKDQTSIIVMLDEKMDVTKEFITFYNARPATTAAVK